MLQPQKTPEQIEAMRQGGRILATVLNDLKDYVAPGMTGVMVDQWVGKQITKYGAEPTYKDKSVNFPGNICISINDHIVHSIPNDLPFEVGDLIGFDLTITYKDMKVDSAFTVSLGEEPKGAKKLLLTQTERALYAGINAVKAGTRVGDISSAIEKVLRKAKLGVIRELIGHGVGQDMHMPPDIPNYGKAGTGPVISVGDTLAIEPMATLGGNRIIVQPNGWDVVTADGSLAAHFEHTVLVLADGCEILTQL